MKKTIFPELLLAASLILTSCGNAGGGSGGSVPLSPPSPAPTASAPAKPGIVTAAIGAPVEGLMNVLYSGNGPYLRSNFGGLFPESGLASAVFELARGQEGPYASEEDALVLEVAKALEAVALSDAAPEPVTPETLLPEDSDYLGFWLGAEGTPAGENFPYLFLFANGEIYLDMQDQAPKRFHAESEEAFLQLRAAMEEVQRKIEDLPLDYHFSLFCTPGKLLPQSTAAGMRLVNNGPRPVRFSREFSVERQTETGWQELTPKEEAPVNDDLLTVPPGEALSCSIDLAALEGGQEEGSYRLTGSFSDGRESLPFTGEYQIGVGDGFEMGYPAPPEMTPENAEYTKKYLMAFGFYSPFQKDFTEEHYLTEFHTYLLYSNMVFLEGKESEYNKLYGMDVPADVVEGTIGRYYLLTPEQIRKNTPKASTNPQECYLPDKNVYHFEGGYGGGSLSPAVVASRREGDLLILSCNWYGMDNSFNYSHDVTIRLEPDGGWKYIANKVTKE